MFGRIIIPFVLVLAAVPLTSAFAADFEEGTNYFEIFPNYPDDDKNHVTVREFFMYTCPHCYDFEPFLKKWLARKDKDIVFVTVPAIFNKTAKMHAEVFYALKLMGKEEELREPFFAAIHKDNQLLDSIEEVEKFLAEKGVDIEKFRNMRQSFAVQTEVNRAGELARRYGITGVPAMVINGKYRTGPTRSFEEKTELVDYLVNKVHKEKTTTLGKNE